MGKKGKLVFKGDKPKKKSKKSKIAKGGRDETTTTKTTTTTTTTTTTATTIDSPRKDDSRSPTATASDAARRKVSSASTTSTIQNGTGRITSSGTVVSGHGTTFEKEISVGDAILVILPNQNKTEEMRIVTMRLSNTSLNLSSAFSHNLSEPQQFRFVRKPRNAEQERKKERQRQLEEANETEKSAFDIYGTAARGANVFTYREKTETGSYRVKQQQLSSSQSTRGDLLSLRSKKTSDKYC